MQRRTRHEGAICLLALSACLRIGYDEQAREPLDAGYVQRQDASVLVDASTVSDANDGSTVSDASVPFDASTPDDAATPLDAAAALDAASAPDAALRDAGPVDAGPTLDAAVDCTTSTRDYCLALPALPQTPLLDGTLDCGPALIELTPTGWNSTQAYAGDHPARYAAAWRADGLYFYVEVDDALLLPARASDNDPWCGDGVELYADADGVFPSAPNYDNPGAVQLLATAPAAAGSTTVLAVDARYHTRSQQRIGDWTAIGHVVAPRANGYALEAFVSAADLDLNHWSLSAGSRVGIDVAINVSVADETQQVDCGYNLGQYYLRVSSTPCTSDSCRPYSNARAFCTPVLE